MLSPISTSAPAAVPHPRSFLVGAPRCGTTALASFLNQHPELFVPYVKEPHFFGSDLTTRRGFPTLESYLELFADAGDRHALEASTWYLYSKEAAREIHDFRPDARIVAMVRNPVDLIHSWHAHVVLLGIEPIPDFAAALDAEDDRRAGRNLPHGSPVEKLQYREIPRFAEQIERYVRVFGRERVHVVVFDDFQRDNHAVFADVVEFLGVDPAPRPEVAVVNSNAAPRSRKVQHMIEHQPEIVRRVVRRLLPRRVRHEVRNAVRRLNASTERRPKLDPALRAELTAEFAPEVARLSELLGRDLSHWSAR